ncbi:hypothetical protein ZWY2020_000971 [Hordeum vulgare]|nr:hypothetical protein ZWY2020_000971 [Hordeum vulgare]
MLAKTKLRTSPAAATRTRATGSCGGGLGPSLVSQLSLNKFSYRLTSLRKKSPLLLAPRHHLGERGGQAIADHPSHQEPSQPSFYYVNLKGLAVGSTHITLPTSAFAVKDDGTGGVIVDSGTSITYLELRSSSQ